MPKGGSYGFLRYLPRACSEFPCIQSNNLYLLPPNLVALWHFMFLLKFGSVHPFWKLCKVLDCPAQLVLEWPTLWANFQRAVSYSVLLLAALPHQEPLHLPSSCHICLMHPQNLPSCSYKLHRVTRALRCTHSKSQLTLAAEGENHVWTF